ncbi:hypothetical protein FHX09_001209 [Rhizobium sp. BK538]|nr:hypothetical protein [Rhizobium sp. BK538]
MLIIRTFLGLSRREKLALALCFCQEAGDYTDIRTVNYRVSHLLRNR